MNRTLTTLSLALFLGTGAFAASDNENTMKRTFDTLQNDIRQYGLFHPAVAKDYERISKGYLVQNRLDEATEYALKALKVEMRLLAPNDPELTKRYFDTGNLYYKHKAHPTALLYMEKAAAIYAAADSESLPLADTYEAVASIYVSLEDPQKALEFNDKALKIRKAKLPADDAVIKRSEENTKFLKAEIEKEKKVEKK
jgi:tetratricopeptide (TPR) repeat protein